MISILFITHYSDLNGANLSLLHLMKELRKYNKYYIYIVAPAFGPFIDECKKLDIQCKIVDFYWWEFYNFNKCGSELKGISKLIKMIKQYMKLFYNRVYATNRIIRIHKKNEIDIVHSNASVIDIGQDVANGLGAKHIWHLREYGYDDYNLSYIMPKKYVKKKFEKAEYLIAISKSIMDYYRDFTDKDNIVLIYNGIKNVFYESESKREREVIKFCCVGLINHNKNQKDIIEAAIKLVQSGYNNFRIYMVGQWDDKYYEELNQIINEFGVKEYIYFLGYQKHIEDTICQMHVGIISSLREAFGRVTIEYMMAGMPVIGSKSGGTVELIDDGINGYLYNVNDIDKLSSLMAKYIKNPLLIDEQGYNARRLGGIFNVIQNTQEICRLYNRCKDIITE